MKPLETVAASFIPSAEDVIELHCCDVALSTHNVTLSTIYENATLELATFPFTSAARMYRVEELVTAGGKISDPLFEQSAVVDDAKLLYEYEHETALPHETTGFHVERYEVAAMVGVERVKNGIMVCRVYIWPPLLTAAASLVPSADDTIEDQNLLVPRAVHVTPESVEV